MLKGTYIPWIHKCVMKTVGYGTSHNTHIYIYSVKYNKHFTKLLYIIFTYKKFIYRVKEMCVYVFSYGCSKFCLVILEDCNTSW